jgi:hypothetical protein
MSLIELVLVLGILAMAFGMLTSTLVANARQRSVNRESAIAADGARDLFEQILNEEYRDVYALYNADPDDDPGGPGTAPGNRFAFEGLTPLPTSPDQMVAEIIMPELSPTAGQWALREDFVDEDLGMPRDLNGDSMIDDLDHANDYVLLPIRLEIEWQGRYGTRRMSVSMMLADIRKVSE